MIGIYMLVSPNKRVYIGQSIDIERRLFEHKHDKRQSSMKLKNSFKKYGFDKHKVTILTECDPADLNKLERFYQDAYSACGRNGLNSKATGYADRSGYMTDEVKQRQSEKSKGRIMKPMTPDEKQARTDKLIETRTKNGTMGKNDKTLEVERLRKLAEEANYIHERSIPYTPPEGIVLSNTKERKPKDPKQVEIANRIADIRRKNGTYGWTPEAKAKMLETKRKNGYVASAETRLKLSKALRGIKRTPEQNKANSERQKGHATWNKGIPRTEAERINIIAGLTGKYTGEKSSRSKLLLNLETGVYYYGCMDAAKSTAKMTRGYINQAVIGITRNKTPFIRV